MMNVIDEQQHKIFQFVFNLMACGKKSNNAPTEEFILESPAPVDVAAKISAIYRELSEKVIDLEFLYNVNSMEDLEFMRCILFVSRKKRNLYF